MKTLTIRGLPDEVHKSLKAKAARNRRSLNQEIIARLVEEGEESDSERIKQVLRAAQEVRRGVVKPLSVEEIRDGIAEGRR